MKFLVMKHIFTSQREDVAGRKMLTLPTAEQPE